MHIFRKDNNKESEICIQNYVTFTLGTKTIVIPLNVKYFSVMWKLAHFIYVNTSAANNGCFQYVYHNNLIDYWVYIQLCYIAYLLLSANLIHNLIWQ